MDDYFALARDEQRGFCELAAAQIFSRTSLRSSPEDRRSAWQQDYEAMKAAMFFGPTPDFAEILSVISAFENRFNKTGA